MANILVVDDSEETCRMLARLLRLANHSAECAFGGEEALVRLTRGPMPELMILDQMMPDMDGIEVMRRLRQQPRTAAIPVVMFSAVQDESFRRYAMRMGATAYWTKASTDFAKLPEAVAAVLKGGEVGEC